MKLFRSKNRLVITVQHNDHKRTKTKVTKFAKTPGVKNEFTVWLSHTESITVTVEEKR